MRETLRVALIGAVASSYSCLKSLLASQAELVGVVTKNGSSFNSDFVDLTGLCDEHNVPFHFFEKVDDAAVVQFLQSCRPDVIFCVGWSFLLDKNVLQIPQLGVVGFHPSPLPIGRGRHPLIWAMVLGLKSTDACFFMMEDGVDSGDIISRTRIEIAEDDTARTLMDKVLEAVERAVPAIVHGFLNDDLAREVQDASKATSWRKRSKADGVIDFRMSAAAIHNLVRGLSEPYPGASVQYGGKEYLVRRSQLVENNDLAIEPGKVLAVSGNDIVVKCGEGAIWIDCNFDAARPKVGEYF